VHDHVTAEDVLSDTFFEVWRNAGRFRGDASVATWLLAIGRNKAISVVRRRSNQLVDYTPQTLLDESDDQETRLHKIDVIGILRRSLTQLSPKHREIINLIYYQEKSSEEAARLLGAGRSTIKTRMFYARKRLSELLVGAGVNHSAS